MKSVAKEKRQGSIALIVTIFLLSAGIRIAIGTTTALADDAPQPGTEEPQTSTDKDATNISSLLKAIGERETKVKEKEEYLKNQFLALQEAEKEIQDRLSKLQTAESSLRKTISIAEEAAEKDLSKLTSVYENMKPKVAAQLFEEMDPEFSAGFLSRMRSESAAQILAGLTPQTAYSISVILAGRNADVPTD